MIVPTPIDLTAGDKFSAAAADAGIRDPLNFLLDGFPRCRVYDGVGLAGADNTDTLLTFSAETFDNDNMHSTSTNTSRIVLTTAGLYEVSIVVQWPNATYTGSNIHVRENSAENNAGGTLIRNYLFQTARMPQARFIRYFDAGDYFQTWILQQSGASRTTAPGEYSTYAEVKWIAKS